MSSNFYKKANLNEAIIIEAVGIPLFSTISYVFNPIACCTSTKRFNVGPTTVELCLPDLITKDGKRIKLDLDIIYRVDTRLKSNITKAYKTSLKEEKLVEPMNISSSIVLIKNCFMENNEKIEDQASPPLERHVTYSIVSIIKDIMSKIELNEVLSSSFLFVEAVMSECSRILLNDGIVMKSIGLTSMKPVDDEDDDCLSTPSTASETLGKEVDSSTVSETIGKDFDISMEEFFKNLRILGGEITEVELEEKVIKDENTESKDSSSKQNPACDLEMETVDVEVDSFDPFDGISFMEDKNTLQKQVSVEKDVNKPAVNVEDTRNPIRYREISDWSQRPLSFHSDKSTSRYSSDFSNFCSSEFEESYEGDNKIECTDGLGEYSKSDDGEVKGKSKKKSRLHRLASFGKKKHSVGEKKNRNKDKETNKNEDTVQYETSI